MIEPQGIGEPEGHPSGSRHVWRKVNEAAPRLMLLAAILLGVVAFALLLASAWASGIMYACLSVTWFLLARGERLRRQTLALLQKRHPTRGDRGLPPEGTVR